MVLEVTDATTAPIGMPGPVTGIPVSETSEAVGSGVTAVMVLVLVDVVPA